MSKCRDLLDMFPEARWIKTRAGCQRRIDEAIKMMSDDADKYGFLYVILEHKGMHLPIAILNDSNRHLCLFLINRGIAVTNA